MMLTTICAQIKQLFTAGSSFLNGFLRGRVFAGKELGLSDLLLYAEVIADSVVLQTDGSFLCSFWFRGSDLETSSDEQLEVLSAQLNTAFSLFGDGWMFHVDIIRHLFTGYIKAEDNAFANPFAAFIDEQRRAHYEQGRCYYENDYVLSITYKPKIDWSSKVAAFFYNSNPESSLSKANDKQNKHGKTIDYSTYLTYFQDKVAEVTTLISQQLSLRLMTTSELVSYLSFCINGELIVLKIPVKYKGPLKCLLASADLTAGESPMLADKYMAAISIMGFPSESFSGILNELNYADFSYRFNTRFIAVDSYDGGKIIERVSDLWYQKRISAADTVKMSLAIDSNIKVNQYAQEQYSNAQSAKALSDSAQVRFGYYTAVVILFATNKNVLAANANTIRNKLRLLGFQSQIERLHTIEAY